MDKPASSGFRWLWLSLVAGLFLGAFLGFAGFWVDFLAGSGAPAARTGVGAVLILGILAIWVVVGALVGAVAGVGLAGLLRSRRPLKESDPGLELGQLLQGNLALLALGGVAIWVVAFLAAMVLDASASIGVWLFVVLWMVPVGILSLWLLAISSAWRKVQRFRPSDDEGDWKKGLTRGIFDTVQQVLVGVVGAAIVSFLVSGVAWAILMSGWGWRAGQVGQALFGMVARDGGTWWLLVGVLVLLQAVLFAIHLWNLKGVALSFLINNLANVILDRLPLQLLPTLPQAPDLFRAAVQAPAGLPLPLRWIWRLLSGRLDPVLEYWDKWTLAPNPREALRDILGKPEPSNPWVVGVAQVVLAVVSVLVL